jgi:hypothetical protein
MPDANAARAKKIGQIGKIRIVNELLHICAWGDAIKSIPGVGVFALLD